jgi:hypothetical protein
MDSEEMATDAVSAPAETAQDAPETPTETPKQDIPAEVKKALQKANKEAETLRLRLKEFEDRDKSTEQKLQEERDALKAERDALYLDNLRREVADEKGLTPAQARRLVGSTRDELEADADDVLEAFPVKAKPVYGDVGQGSRSESAQRVYTQAELNDFAFFQEHKADILLAQREGRIL